MLQMHGPNLLIVGLNYRRRQNIGDHQHQHQKKGQEIQAVYGAVGRDSARRPNEIVPVVNYSYLKQGQYGSSQRVEVDGSAIRQIVLVVVAVDLVALKHEQRDKSPAKNGGDAEDDEAAEASKRSLNRLHQRFEVDREVEHSEHTNEIDESEDRDVCG